MSERAPGFEDYIPSRLEWLALALNSVLPYIDVPIVEKTKLNRIIVPMGDGKTLKLMVIHPKEIRSEKLEMLTDNLVKHIKEYAKIYNWESWIEVEVEYVPE